MGRPRRRVQDGGHVGIEPERLLDGAPVERSIDKAIDFGISDERRFRAFLVDEACLRVALEPVSVREQEPVEAGDDRGEAHWRVESVLPRDTVEKMDAPCTPLQPGHVPEIGIHVSIELHPARGFRCDQAFGNARGSENLVEAPDPVGGGEPEFEAVIALELVQNRPEDGKAHAEWRLRTGLAPPSAPVD